MAAGWAIHVLVVANTFLKSILKIKHNIIRRRIHEIFQENYIKPVVAFHWEHQVTNNVMVTGPITTRRNELF